MIQSFFFLGATQNSIKVAQVHSFAFFLCFLFGMCEQLLKSRVFFSLADLQWMLQIPGATSYMGSIGKDKYGEAMKKDATAAGVNVNPMSLSPLVSC